MTQVPTEILVQPVDIDIFDRHRRGAAWAVARAALGLAHSNPVGRLIACAAETAAIHKGFQQMNAMPVLSLPVGADAP